jgi:hypothetical protein
MPVPRWKLLVGALTRFPANGLYPERAKRLISSAIGEREIRIRVKVDQTDPDIPGEILEGQQVNPPRDLGPDDLDWIHSKPQGAWETGPDTLQEKLEARYFDSWDWRPRRITKLELRMDDVSRILKQALERGLAADDEDSTSTLLRGDQGEKVRQSG